MDEAIDRIGREYEQAESERIIRDMAHTVWVYFAALMAEGFLAKVRES